MNGNICLADCLLQTIFLAIVLKQGVRYNNFKELFVIALNSKEFEIITGSTSLKNIFNQNFLLKIIDGNYTKNWHIFIFSEK